MAKFRKLHDGYEYVIGRKYVCIRNKEKKYRELVEKREIGWDYGTVPNEKVYITPGAVDYWIKHQDTISPKDLATRVCEHFYMKRRLLFSPYQLEIEGKKILCYYCEDCIDASEMSI